MINKLRCLITGLIFCAVTTVLGQAATVEAIDAFTDNSTVPGLYNISQYQNEIRPRENCILLGPSSQSQTAQPNVILSFTGLSEQENFKVIADETWNLEVDINMAGWLYLYEYFPHDANLQGKWVAYKWQVPQSGRWKLGPFIPDDDEPEGQHIYRIWFYSDGQWAGNGSNPIQNNLVYWTYIKRQPTEQAPPKLSIAAIKEVTLTERLYSSITQPFVYILIILISILILSLYQSRKYLDWSKSRSPMSQKKSELLSVVLSSNLATAKILLPNGMEIQFASNSRIIGRGDLARALDLDELGLISKQHFKVKSGDEQFYIEDLGSVNGTMLNGENIGGKGLVNLNHEDIIEPAGITRLKFYLL